MPLDEHTLIHSDELMHYGILGMKWGVRKDRETNGRIKKLAFDTIDNILIPTVELFTPFKTSSKDVENGLPTKTKMFSKDEDMKAVNPNYGTGKLDYRMNCAYCTIAYDLRRRGYDVEALPNTNIGSIDREVFILNAYEDFNIYTGMNSVSCELPSDSPEDAKNLEQDMIKKFGDGSRGTFFVEWENGGGHAVIWEIEGNKVVIRDSQNGKKYSVFDYMKCAKKIEYFRTDNLKPSKRIFEYVQPKGQYGPYNISGDEIGKLMNHSYNQKHFTKTFDKIVSKGKKFLESIFKK